MASLISENFKFIALFFRSRDVMIFNGLIGLGTVASQTAYNIFAFNCPCSPKKNYLYGLAAIGVPALAFFCDWLDAQSKYLGRCVRVSHQKMP